MVFHDAEIPKGRLADLDTKAKKRKQLRNNEYYDMQEVFDQLYANAGNNAKFTHLMLSPELK